MARDDGGETTTVGTRFSAGELELLQRAAALKQWSVAKLLRLGAIEKAAHIINASGDNSHPVRNVLSRVVQQLRSPMYRLFREGKEFSEAEYDHWYSGHDDLIEMDTLTEQEVIELGELIRKVGAELAPMLAEECARADARHGGLRQLIDPTLAASAALDEPPMSKEATSGGEDVRRAGPNPKSTRPQGRMRKTSHGQGKTGGRKKG